MTPVSFILLIVTAVAVAWALSLRSRLRDQVSRAARDLDEERRLREASFQAEAARTAAIFDRMIDGVIIVGPNGRIRLANRAAMTLFDAPASMQGLTPIEATRSHEVAGILRSLESQAEVLDLEVRIERISGAITVQINALALLAPDGAREGALLVFNDVTRLRQLESVRQDFVANVSHELRTPLSLIKGAAETLIDGGKADAAITDRFLEIIDKNANRLTLLIDDLLLLSRLDSGRVDLKLQPVPLQRAAQDVVDDAARVARARSVSLHNDIGREAVARADPDRLRQVLANLVDNAIKYGRPEGNVSISCRPLNSLRVEVCVRDDGPGIPSESQPRVFERFYRVDKARSREQGGTGLGLAIVKNVIEAHGGEVRVESTPGQGTSFYFTLRVA